MKNLVCLISDQRVNKLITRLSALLAIAVIIPAFVF
jgi:hypothetical protein